MARPKKSEDEKRVHQVNIRLTKDEDTKSNEFAAASGISQANWIREKVFTGKLPPVKLSPIEAGVYHELKKIGVNLNQVTHKINIGEMPKEYLTIQLSLQCMLTKIYKALIDDRKHD